MLCLLCCVYCDTGAHVINICRLRGHGRARSCPTYGNVKHNFQRIALKIPINRSENTPYLEISTDLKMHIDLK